MNDADPAAIAMVAVCLVALIGVAGYLLSNIIDAALESWKW